MPFLDILVFIIYLILVFGIGFYFIEKKTTGSTISNAFRRIFHFIIDLFSY